MLALWIAAGLLDAAAQVSPIIAVQELTAAAVRKQATTAIGNAIPLGAAQWEQPYEPGDHAPYVFTFAALLPGNERIASIVSIRMSPAAAALGVKVDDDPFYAPIIDQTAGKMLRVYFAVVSELEDSVSFDGAGVRLPVSFRVLTDAKPPNRYERTGVLVVRQQ